MGALQGDAEAQRQLPVTPMCDRKSVIVSSNQLRFIQYLLKVILLHCTCLDDVMLRYAMLCCASSCCTVPCYAVVLCRAVLCYAMLCYAMLCYAMLCYAMLFDRHCSHAQLHCRSAEFRFNACPLSLFFLTLSASRCCSLSSLHQSH